MARRPPRECRQCGVRLPGRRELELNNKPLYLLKKKYCDTCSIQRGQERRARTGARLLTRAKTIGLEEHEGQTFTVVQLPPKRRRK